MTIHLRKFKGAAFWGARVGFSLPLRCVFGHNLAVLESNACLPVHEYRAGRFHKCSGRAGRKKVERPPEKWNQTF